jgi:acyl-CoA thioesterase
MQEHVFDQAIALQALDDGIWQGRTSAAYANMVGPFGGLSGAQALNAVLQQPQLLGEPVSLTVNFCAAVVDGAFEVRTRPARTNRSTQHWVIEMLQQGQTVLTATAFTATRRETWGVDEEPMPRVVPPDQVPLPAFSPPVEFVRRYEIRPLTGGLPGVWDGSGESSLTRMWLRDNPPRPLDFVSLAAMSDIFFPRVFIRRARHVPAGTVSMTAYFHASAQQLAQVGTGYLLGQARAQAFRNGYFDQTSQLWSLSGDLLVTAHQIVYYKE